jgi:hypothetical protein
MTADELASLEGVTIRALDGVREHTERWPVELRREVERGRLLITAYNEGHNNMTQVDLFDLLDWLACGPPDGRSADGFIVEMRNEDGSDPDANNQRS